MPAALDASIRVNYFAPPQRFATVLGDSALLAVSFTDNNGVASFPTDPAITVQSPSTDANPMPAAIVFSLLSTPPMQLVGAEYQVRITPGWTGAWGARGSCTSPDFAAQDTGFDVIASSAAAPAPESPAYAPQALVDPSGASVAEAAASAAAASTKAGEAAASAAAAIAAVAALAPGSLASLLGLPIYDFSDPRNSALLTL